MEVEVLLIQVNNVVMLAKMIDIIGFPMEHIIIGKLASLLISKFI
jgi:hypothetical protein